MSVLLLTGLVLDLVGASMLVLAEIDFFRHLPSKFLLGKYAKARNKLVEKLELPKSIPEVKQRHWDIIDEDKQSFVAEIDREEAGFEGLKSIIQKDWPHVFEIDKVIILKHWEKEKEEVKRKGRHTDEPIEKETRHGYPVKQEERTHYVHPPLVYIEGEHFGRHRKKVVATLEDLKESVNSEGSKRLRLFGLALILIGFLLQILSYL